MPGRFFLTRPIADVGAALGVEVGSVREELVRYNIAPGQEIIVLEKGRLTRMRWGIVPVGRVNARGRPVMETIVNARSETVFAKSAFEGVRRCVVPVDGWYEWTGEKRKKTAWRIAPKDGGLLLFAAIADTWNGPGGVVVDQVATVTCEPNGDVGPIHHRMGVILPPDAVTTWLNDDTDAAARLMVPYTDGLLDIATAGNIDWSAP
ncbi:SOS response-associated peptidase [uncultured Litoreibacter sp.]|uniref:SOS response-associated peptidase n=1 Tax=uncultured Litoreibacter sp. TaxID=1392394 RepID=UPI00260EED16|nr:SOS response-associated peptidase [uncultured Litoreibacter sp.]